MIFFSDVSTAERGNAPEVTRCALEEGRFQMAVSRRRSGYNFVDSATSAHGQPKTVCPPDGYCMIETDLHRATIPLQAACFPFLSRLKLRSAINLSAEPLNTKEAEFLRSSGVVLLSPPSLEAFDGPYDLWEEAAKESLELVLDANNHPMIILDSSSECESACLVGCLRRLLHWSVCAIHDEYQMITLRSTSYDTNQRFIERFDPDLVTQKANLPVWFREHVGMLEEERAAEQEVLQTDPERPNREWAQGLCTSQDGVTTPASISSQGGSKELSLPHIEGDSAVGGGQVHASNGRSPLPRTGTGDNIKAGRKGVRGVGQQFNGTMVEGVVPDYRLNGFVYVCPLVSAKSAFTGKAWLQDEDD